MTWAKIEKYQVESTQYFSIISEITNQELLITNHIYTFKILAAKSAILAE